MKICFVSNLFSPYVIGGAEIYVQRIAKKLSENHEVTVITSRPYKGLLSLRGESYKEGKIKVYSFYPLNFYHAYDAKKKPSFIKPFWHAWDINNLHSNFLISRILREEKPDIVHTHNLDGLSLSVVKAVKNFGFNLVHTCHDFSLLCPYATLICPRKQNGFCEKPNFFCGIYRYLKKKAINDKPDCVIFPSK